MFTDVFGGNRLGLYTVLVRPLSRDDFVTTRLSRLVERWLLRRLGMEVE
jgi:predicted HAD superfamily phosphohydrolase YqeG